MCCMACCTILMKTNIARINTMINGYKKMVIAGMIGVYIDRNGCAVLNLKEMIMPPLHKPQQTSALASVRPCVTFLST